MHAAAIWAMERAVAIDPTVPAATGFSLAVFAVEGGSAIAVTRPFAEAWLYDEPDPPHADHGRHPAALRGAREPLTARVPAGGATYSQRKRPAAMSVVARPMPPTIVTWSRSKP